jgi:hypothetical protein
MLTTIARLLLTATALAPIAAVYGYVFLMEQQYRSALIAVGLCVALVAACTWLLHHLQTKAETSEFHITSIEAADRENVAFLILYVFPLLTSDITELHWNLVVPILVVFGVVISTGFNYHFNPLLGIAGWHFYRVSTDEGVTFVLITKRRLRDINHSFRVAEVTEYIVIDVEDS